MTFSRFEQDQQEMSSYFTKFGALPEGLHKYCADTRQVAGLKRGMQEAISSEQPVKDWGLYVTRLRKVSKEVA